jgi:hypothetical protein
MFEVWNFKANVRNIGNKKSSEPGADGYMIPDGAVGGAVAELPVLDPVPAEIKIKALEYQKELRQPGLSHSSRSSLSTRNKSSPLPPPPPSSPPPKIPDGVYNAESCVLYTNENRIIINPSFNPFEDENEAPPVPACPDTFKGARPKIGKKPSFKKIRDLVSSQPLIMKGSFADIMERQRRKADGIVEETIEMTDLK